MKKISIYSAIVISLVLGTAYARGTKIMDAWPFAAPVVEQESSVVTPSQGDIMFDYTSSTDGDFKGYNGSAWVNLGAGSGNTIPAGTILPFAGTSAPTGYLLADGSPVSRTTYATLFAAIGTAFGAGDGVNTFNVPDLRGRFLRGVDGGAGRDPNAGTRTAMNTGGNTGDAVGSVEADAFKSHGHNVLGNSGGGSVSTPGNSLSVGLSGGTSGSGLSYWANANSGNPYIQATGGSETRPINANVNFIIKY
jgi:microcystin-dependent protein